MVSLRKNTSRSPVMITLPSEPEYQLDNYLYKLEREGRIKVIKQDELERLADDYIRPPIAIMAEDHAEKLFCRICGKKYVSRGKNDPGICRECAAREKATLVGGPLDGEKAFP